MITTNNPNEKELPKIKSAFYGSKEKEINVTEIIKNTNQITVSNETFGNDPHYRRAKRLKIEFEDGSVIEIKEGSVWNKILTSKTKENTITNPSNILDRKIHLEFIEIEVTQRCTLSCRNCSKNTPFFKCDNAEFKELDLKQFEQDIVKLNTALEIDWLYIIGGEPLLYPNLKELVNIIKSKKPSQKACLITNGTLFEKTDDSIIRLFDRIKVSLYANVLTEKQKQEIEFRCKRNQIPLSFLKMNNFREVFCKEKKEYNDLDHKKCSQYKRLYCYSYGHFFLCTSAHSINKIIHNKIIDGVSLSDTNAIENIKKHFLCNTKYNACHFCKEMENIFRPWSQATRDEWMTEKYS